MPPSQPSSLQVRFQLAQGSSPSNDNQSTTLVADHGALPSPSLLETLVSAIVERHGSWQTLCLSLSTAATPLLPSLGSRRRIAAGLATDYFFAGEGSTPSPRLDVNGLHHQVHQGALLHWEERDQGTAPSHNESCSATGANVSVGVHMSRLPTRTRVQARKDLVNSCPLFCLLRALLLRVCEGAAFHWREVAVRGTDGTSGVDSPPVLADHEPTMLHVASRSDTARQAGETAKSTTLKRAKDDRSALPGQNLPDGDVSESRQFRRKRVLKDASDAQTPHKKALSKPTRSGTGEACRRPSAALGDVAFTHTPDAPQARMPTYSLIQPENRHPRGSSGCEAAAPVQGAAPHIVACLGMAIAPVFLMRPVLVQEARDALDMLAVEAAEAMFLKTPPVAQEYLGSSDANTRCVSARTGCVETKKDHLADCGATRGQPGALAFPDRPGGTSQDSRVGDRGEANTIVRKSRAGGPSSPAHGSDLAYSAGAAGSKDTQKVPTQAGAEMPGLPSKNDCPAEPPGQQNTGSEESTQGTPAVARALTEIADCLPFRSAADWITRCGHANFLGRLVELSPTSDSASSPSKSSASATTTSSDPVEEIPDFDKTAQPRRLEAAVWRHAARLSAGQVEEFIERHMAFDSPPFVGMSDLPGHTEEPSETAQAAQLPHFLQRSRMHGIRRTAGSGGTCVLSGLREGRGANSLSISGMPYSSRSASAEHSWTPYGATHSVAGSAAESLVASTTFNPERRLRLVLLALASGRLGRPGTHSPAADGRSDALPKPFDLAEKSVFVAKGQCNHESRAQDKVHRRAASSKVSLGAEQESTAEDVASDWRITTYLLLQVCANRSVSHESRRLAAALLPVLPPAGFAKLREALP